MKILDRALGEPLKKATIVSFLFWGGGILFYTAYHLLGKPIITDAYHGLSFGFLDFLFGKKVHPLEIYQAVADKIAFGIVTTALILSVIPYVYYVLESSSTTQQSPVRRSIHRNRWLCSFPTASLVYTVILLAFFYPYFGTFSSSLIGPPEDNMQDFWNSWYFQKFLDGNEAEFFKTTMLYFPEGASLRYHSFSYSNLVPEYIIRKLLFLPLTHPVLISVHNGMSLFSFLLSSLGAYLLIRYLTRSSLAGIVGGFIFGFSPFHYAHTLHHVHVATIQYIPFFVLCFLKYVETRQLRFCLGAVVFYALSALSSWYYLVYLLYFLIFYWGWRAIKERSLFPQNTVFPIAQVGGATMLLLSPLILPMVLEESSKSYAEGHDVYVADLVGFVVFHPYHLLGSLTERVSGMMTGTIWEATVYLGLINIALALWVIRLQRHQATEATGATEAVSLALWGMIFFMVWSFGSSLHILGRSSPIPMPTALTQDLPLFGNIRTPSRAIVFVYLFLGLLVGVGIKYFAEGGGKRLVLINLLLLIVLDYYPTRRESTLVRVPEGYEIIAADKEEGFGIWDLPWHYVNGNTYMMYQTFHGRPIVNASISRRPESPLGDRLEESGFASLDEKLAENRIKYVVIHKRLEKPKEGTVEELLERFRSSYPLMYEDQEVAVFQSY